MYFDPINTVTYKYVITSSLMELPISDDRAIWVPYEIWSIIIDPHLDNLSYLDFKTMECVCSFWCTYLNSFKFYLYSQVNNNLGYGLTAIMTINREAKQKDTCCSIYLNSHPNLKKQGHLKFFRKEYYDFSPDLPKTIAEEHNHNITGLRFPTTSY